MKRLFMLGRPSDGFFFEKKEDAKAFRDANPKIGCVQIGPDHWKWAVDRAEMRTHSHSMNDGAGDGFRKTSKQRRKQVKK